MLYKIKDILTEFKEININSKYPPVAVGRYGIRNRSDIYKKELSNDYSKNKVIRKNNLIIGLGSVQIDVGVLCDDYVYSVSPAYHTYLIDTSIVLPKFLEFVFKVNNLTWFDKYSVPAARQGRKIDLTSLFNEKINIPSLDIQGKLISKVEHILRLLRSNENELICLNELIKSRFNEMFKDVTKIEKIDNICSICRGASPRPISKFLTQSDGINWIKIGDVDENDIYITKSKEKITIEGASKSRIVKPGDFVLSNSMSFGRPYILGITGCVHDGWLIISNYSEHLDPIFFYYELRSSFVQEQFNVLAGGSTVKNLNSDLVKKVSIHLPEMDSQKDFVTFAKQIDKLKFN